MRRLWVLRFARVAGVIAASLTLATLATGFLESSLGIENASIVYIVAVAVTAVLAGTPGAIGTSIGAFLLYDFFFVQPLYTLTIQDPQEWLNVLLLLFVGILVGQLAATQRQQTETAREREREARALFRVSRALASRSASAIAAGRAVAEGIVAETAATRVWLEIAGPDGADRVVVDTAPGQPRPVPSTVFVLRRTDGDAPAEWTQVHVGKAPGTRATRADRTLVAHKVPMEASGRRTGSLWAMVPGDAGRPGRTDTRLLATVADQVAQAVEADRLANEARTAAIARESDRVKTALLETVSHDLRTPLAAIRAAAGTLMDRTVNLPEDDRYATAAAIDSDAERLNRIVTNLLDLSRVEGGALRPELDGYDLDDLVEAAVARARPRLGEREIRVELGSPPPVRVDPTFLDQILDNLFENIARYAGPGAPVRVSAVSVAAGQVRVTVEDGGVGVPDDALPRLFDKFYRVSRRGPAARGGSGIGMAVVRGFAEAMGGSVTARRSAMGGLAVDVDLPAAEEDRDAGQAPAEDGIPDEEPGS
jgi:two-component system sensor histidine kinase KdpD